MPDYVLLVDDLAPLRDALRVLFEQQGHSVRDFPDAIQALTHVELARREEPPCQPWVIIIDIVMPKVDGIGLVLEFLGKYPDLKVPIIFYSGIAVRLREARGAILEKFPDMRTKIRTVLKPDALKTLELLAEFAAQRRTT